MRFVCVFVFLCSIFVAVTTAHASERKFFQGIQGKWNGPGEIVAGKYKGTKFVCNFDGDSLARKTGMNIDGSCRVGVFSQKMSAFVSKAGSRYKGQFLDGAAGEGMDVTGGRYTKSKLVVDIVRKDLRGVMIASLSKQKKLNITISVHVGRKLVPVIGMTLNRVGNKNVAAKQN